MLRLLKGKQLGWTILKRGFTVRKKKGIPEQQKQLEIDSIKPSPIFNHTESTTSQMSFTNMVINSKAKIEQSSYDKIIEEISIKLKNNMIDESFMISTDIILNSKDLNQEQRAKFADFIILLIQKSSELTIEQRKQVMLIINESLFSGRINTSRTITDLKKNSFWVLFRLRDLKEEDKKVIYKKVFSDCYSALQTLDLEQLPHFLKIYQDLLEELLIERNLIKTFSPMIKKVNNKLIHLYLETTEDNNKLFKTLYNKVKKLTKATETKISMFYSAAEYFLFITHLNSNDYYALEFEKTLDDKTKKEIAQFIETSDNPEKNGDILFYIFEDNYNFNDKTLKMPQTVFNLKQQFKDKFEVFKRFYNSYDNKAENSEILIFINSRSAFNDGNLDYFLNNKSVINKLKPSLLSSKITFYFLLTVLRTMEEKDNYNNFQKAFYDEMRRLTMTDNNIINLIKEYKMRSRYTNKRYRELVLEKLAFDKLRMKIVIALKEAALDSPNPGRPVNIKLIDDYFEFLNTNPKFKTAMLYELDSMKDLIQNIILNLNINERNISLGSYQNEGVLFNAEYRELVISVIERGMAFYRDNTTINKEDFEAFLKSKMDRYVEVGDKTPYNSFMISPDHLASMDYNYMSNYLENTFESKIIQRRHDEVLKPIKSDSNRENKRAIYDDINLRLFYWQMINLMSKDLNHRVDLGIKIETNKDLATKIAELSAKMDLEDGLWDSQRYLDMANTTFEEDWLQSEVDSIGMIHNKQKIENTDADFDKDKFNLSFSKDFDELYKQFNDNEIVREYLDSCKKIRQSKAI